MIDAEEKKIVLKDILDNWTENTRIKPYLRDYDIPNLISQIIDTFYPIQLSCGHRVRNLNEGISLKFKEYVVDRSDMEHGGGMGEIFGDYCKDCANAHIKLGAKKVNVRK
jgi:hypothetical protein